MKRRSGMHPDISAIPYQQSPTIIDRILRPGLGAELAAALQLLPTQPHYEYSAGKNGIWWKCDFRIPKQIDPQHPEPYYHLVEILDREIPECLGDNVQRKDIGLLSLRILRKGSWMEIAKAQPNTAWFYLIVDGGDWPIEWGGHLIHKNEHILLSSNRLIITSDAHSISLVQRHIESFLIFGQFTIQEEVS